jgi:hypothetical protein
MTTGVIAWWRGFSGKTCGQVGKCRDCLNGEFWRLTAVSSRGEADRNAHQKHSNQYPSASVTHVAPR